MKLCVIGTGYVGLVGAAVFAERGHDVVGVDKDTKKLEMIRSGVMPIYEKGLAEVVQKVIADGKFTLTDSIAEGIKDAEVVFICVGTPQSDNGSADLSAVWAVAQEIGKSLNGYKIIVTKSTVPVGTNERIGHIIRENLGTEIEFDIASNPEFLKEGDAVEDMRKPDRTIIGSDSRKALDILNKLYSDTNAPVLECDLRSAEMIKYASNAFLATKISFINEIGQLCERANANVEIVAKGMGMDKRVGPAFLRVTGVGYGGSCFPKDVAALYKTSTDQAYDFKLLRSVMEVNELQKFNFFKKITTHLGENLSGKVFAVLGLAFKYGTDDIRESGAIKEVKMLRGNGAMVRAFDPAAMENTQATLGTDGIYYAKDIADALEGADALCIFTDWPEFKDVDLAQAKKLMRGNVIFDARNMLSQQRAEDEGFTYFAVGKRTNGYTEAGEIQMSALLQNGKK